jgi:hypothetical protein
VTRDCQADSQDEADYLLSKVTARYDEIEAEQQRLTVCALLLTCSFERISIDTLLAAAVAVENLGLLRNP